MVDSALAPSCGTTADGPDVNVLAMFLGRPQEGLVRLETLDGLLSSPALAALSEPTLRALCGLALAHECDVLEKSLAQADEADAGARADGASADADVGSAAGGYADADGRECGASFCGFYHERDIFSWAERAEAAERASLADPRPASGASALRWQAVFEARAAIEAAIVAAGIPLRAQPVRCEAWLNVLRHGDFLKLHDHAGALVSGVVWLHVPPAAELCEAGEQQPGWSGAFLAARQAEGGRVEYCVLRARERWAALFPGSLHHAVLPLYAEEVKFEPDLAVMAGEGGAGDDAGSAGAGGRERILRDEWSRTRISLSFNYISS